MVQLYKMNNTNFEWNGDYSLTPLECTFKQELNGMWEITLIHPLEGNWKQINYEDVIKVNTPNKPQLFRIYDKFKSIDGITVKARHIFYDLKDKILMDVRPTNQNGKGYLDIILQGTKFIGSSNITKIATSYFIRRNIVEAINGSEENSFTNRLGGEILLDNFNIVINDRIGQDNGVICSYGKDLESIDETLTIDNVVTRGIIIGADGIVLPYTIDSPNINKYANIKEKIIPFDSVKVGEGEGCYANLELAYKELDRLGKIYLNNNDKPLVNYKIDILALENTEEYKDFKDLQRINLGDTVTIKHKLLDIDIKVRCIAIEYDCLNSKYISIDLGNYIHNVIDNINKNAKEIEDTKERLQDTKKDIGTTIENTKDGLKLDIKNTKEGLEQNINNTAEGLKIDMKNTKESLEGKLDFTAKQLKIQFQEADSNLNSYISQTARNIQMQVQDVEKNTSGRIDVLDREISSKVSEGEVYSIVKQSPDAVKYAFNGISANVTIDRYGLTVENGTIRSVDIIGCHFVGSKFDGSDADFGDIDCQQLHARGHADLQQGLSVGDDIYARGVISCGGEKKCIQHTDNHGDISFYSLEFGESYLGDKGFGHLVNGVCRIDLDPRIIESVNTDSYYHVRLDKYGPGDIYTTETHKDYFIVKGDKDIRFGWTLEGKRRGFENKRLEEVFYAKPREFGGDN